MKLPFLNARVKKLKKAFKREKCFKEYPAIQTVLILFTPEDREAVAAYMDVLKADGKTVQAFGFFDGKQKELPVMPEPFLLWSKKNLTFMGLVKPLEWKAIQAFKPDTLMDLRTREDAVTDLVSLSVPAEYRVGFHRSNDSLGDFMLEYQPEQDVRFLIEQLHFYIKTLRTK
jgi:hypothetical protein